MTTNMDIIAATNDCWSYDAFGPSNESDFQEDFFVGNYDPLSSADLIPNEQASSIMSMPLRASGVGLESQLPQGHEYQLPKDSNVYQASPAINRNAPSSVLPDLPSPLSPQTRRALPTRALRPGQENLRWHPSVSHGQSMQLSTRPNGANIGHSPSMKDGSSNSPLFVTDEDFEQGNSRHDSWNPAISNFEATPTSPFASNISSAGQPYPDHKHAHNNDSTTGNNEAFTTNGRGQRKPTNHHAQQAYSYNPRKTRPRGLSNKVRPPPLANMTQSTAPLIHDDWSSSTMTTSGAGRKRSRDPTLDPENHQIKYLRTVSRRPWADIARHLNEQRTEVGKEATYTEAAVYGRFVRNAPRIARQEGDTKFDPKDFMFLRNDGKTAAEVTSPATSGLHQAYQDGQHDGLPSGHTNDLSAHPVSLQTQSPVAPGGNGTGGKSLIDEMVWAEIESIDWPNIARKVKDKFNVDIDTTKYHAEYERRYGSS
ncbi:MAG: hypothetical protein M1828_000571 [Chrysothrix sp. TS-e1954]|nr:MAG: hypothetical protein M1828_000571 [Chrysothrix sp. TS-e1954]